MITEAEFDAHVSRNIVRKPQSFLGGLIVSILTNLAAKYIYNKCIKTHGMSALRIRRKKPSDRLRLRRVIRDLSGDKLIEAEWNHNMQEKFSPDFIYNTYGEMAYDNIWDIGATLKPEDLE